MSVLRNQISRLGGMLSSTLDMLATGTITEGSSFRNDWRILSVGSESDDAALLACPPCKPIMEKPVRSDTATGSTYRPSEGAIDACTIGSQAMEMTPEVLLGGRTGSVCEPMFMNTKRAPFGSWLRSKGAERETLIITRNW